MNRPVRIIAVYREVAAHRMYPDGFVIHPDDRAVREVGAETKAAKKGRRR